MKKHSKFAPLTNILAIGLLCSAPISAEIPSEHNKPENAQIGVRPLSQDSLQKYEKEITEEPQEETLSSGAEGATRIPPYTSYSSFSYHTLKTKGASTSIELEDGSWWKISSSDSWILSGWQVGDFVTITPNTGWFSSARFLIQNKSRGTHVKAEIEVGPETYGPYSWLVQSLDVFSGIVCLAQQSINGVTQTYWKVDFSDNYLLREWAVNDTVIVGVNDNWFSSYDNILINVNMNHFLRAKFY